MSERLEQKGDPVPPERLAEASVWIARLHSGEPDKTAIAGVKRWLRAHPMNQRALELCTEIWEESANLRRITPFATQIPAATPRRYGLVSMAAAAALVLVLVASVFLWLAPSADLATEVGEQRLVTLKDGTHVFLNTATRIAVKYDAATRLVELKTGEALFDVAKKPTWPFIVKAGDRQIRALGTSFVVRRDETQTAVTLMEGTVTVTADGSAPHEHTVPAGSGEKPVVPQVFTLKPGQRLTFLAGQARLDSASRDKAVAWRRGEIIFDDTPLSDAASELNRYSKDKLVVEQPAAQAMRVTGLFQTGDSLSFAHAVAQSYGLTVEERSDQIVLSGSPALHTPAKP
jgi:transmembrane sensor